MLGRDPKGRDELTELAQGQVIGLRSGLWKFVPQQKKQPTQLYDLSKDVGEKNNLVESNPAKVAELQARFDAIVGAR